MELLDFFIMNLKNIQEILSLVEMPSRYLGSEVNTVKKDIGQVDLTVALAFPDLYEIGTSHFGLQILYTILNSRDNIAAERFFTPAPDMEKILLEKKIPLCSLESQRDFRQFDIIGFSLLYELNFTNILTMLHLANIPFYSEERDETFPIIIGGGPCAFNPEPLSDFFDAFVIGDGENTILSVSEAVIGWKKEGDGRKKTLLKILAGIEGVYVPSFFRVDFDSNGFQHLSPLEPGYEIVRRAILPDLADAPFPVSPVVPFGKPVHDRLRLEIARGCSRACRFCQAGMIYRPVRERSVTDLVEIAEKSLGKTGYSDISLLSLSTGDYGDLARLMESLMALNKNHCTSLSLPSVRAGRLTSDLMNIIKKVKKTGFTIAPEAGTQRLRDVINKNITEKDIFDTVTAAFDLGWRRIKLYFMNGLPTETHEDIEGICDLARRLAAVKINGRGKSKINVSFATFIPKPHTPFHRCAQISTEQSMENLAFLKQNLRHPGINLKWQNPEMSLLEGVWARGDRKLSTVLVAAWRKGCRLDGWSDHFNFERWQEVFGETGVDPMFYTTRRRQVDEPLPWAHIDSGISLKYMEKEYEKALGEEITEDCRDHDCAGCGICDFKTVKPVLHNSTKDPSVFQVSGSGSPLLQAEDAPPPIPPECFKKFRVFYSRQGNAKHFGHLELAKIIRRALRRTGTRVKYSSGFNPTMKVSFDNPLPVGMESEEEFFNLYAHVDTDTESLVKELNRGLPENLCVTDCILAPRSGRKNDENRTAYRVDLKGYPLSPSKIDEFMQLSEYVVEQTSFKGKRRVVDLRKVTDKIVTTGDSTLEIVLKKYNERTIRPAEILTEVFGIPEENLRVSDILKLKQDNVIC